MIIYRSTLSEFFDDVNKRRIIDKIETAMGEYHIGYDHESEERAWMDSTRNMKEVLEKTGLPGDVGVFIEFNIPFTASRIDFGITGFDRNDTHSAVIVELKFLTLTSCAGITSGCSGVNNVANWRLHS